MHCPVAASQYSVCHVCHMCCKSGPCTHPVSPCMLTSPVGYQQPCMSTVCCDKSCALHAKLLLDEPCDIANPQTAGMAFNVYESASNTLH